MTESTTADKPTQFEGSIKAEIEEVVRLPKIHYLFAKSGITYIIMKSGEQFELADAEKEYTMLQEHSDRLPLKVIIHSEPHVTVSMQVRRFWLTGKGKHVIAHEAIVSDDLTVRLALLATRQILKTFGVNVKLFRRLPEAEAWLQKQVMADQV